MVKKIRIYNLHDRFGFDGPGLSRSFLKKFFFINDFDGVLSKRKNVMIAV